jgi:hypothetical protein
MKTVAILVGSSDINLIADFKRMFIMYLLFTYKVVCVSQNVLKFFQQLTGEERRAPLIFGRNNQ